MWSVFDATLFPLIAFEFPNPNSPLATRFCRVWRSAVKLNEVLSVGRLIARRYLDGPEVLSLRFLNFTAESTSKLRRMRNSRLLPRVQSTNREVRRSIWRGWIRARRYSSGSHVGLKLGKCLPNTRDKARICELGLRQVFKELESHSCASAPYYAQPRSQRTESHNLSYLINALHLYSTSST
jgi:hypothetical protein